MNKHLFSFNEIKITWQSKVLGPAIASSLDTYQYLINDWPDIEYCESFYIILLNRSNKILGIALISTGGVAGTAVDPKKIFQYALKAHASGIILAHNHPSGQLRPSQNDIKITDRCKIVGEAMDMPIMDHLIITNAGYFSFADEGML